MQIKKRQKTRLRRKLHVKKKVFGTADKPRLSVFRSNKHMYAQVIDDMAGVTLASMSTRSKSLRTDLAKTGNKQAAEAVGAAVARQAMQVGIKCVRFDRNRYRFHGRTKALADAARKAGLVF